MESPICPSVPAHAELIVYISLAFVGRRHLPVANPGALTFMLKVSHHANRVASGEKPPAGVRFRKILKMRIA